MLFRVSYMDMEKRFATDRLIGKAPTEEKRALMDELKNRFLTQHTLEATDEVAKDPETLRIMDLADAGTNAVLQKYGEQPFNIPEKNIHLFREGVWFDGYSGGMTLLEHQGVLVKHAKGKLVLYMRTFHEMLHIKSHYTPQIRRDEEGTRLDSYRIGLVVISQDGGKKYFNNLNEAVTEELNKRYATRNVNDPVFGQEQRYFLQHTSSEWRKAHTDAYTFYPDPKKPKEEKEHLIPWGFTYQRERRLLLRLCKKVADADPKSYSHPDEVFDVFAKAAIGGNILPLGRMLERIFGKGTFRRLGEAGNDTNEFEKVIDSLTKV